MIYILLLLLVFIVIWQWAQISVLINDAVAWGKRAQRVGVDAELFRTCRDCDGNYVSDRGTAVLNPFIWPYSATSCVDDLYRQRAEVDIGSPKRGPLTSLTTPDHVLLTN